MGWYGDYRDIDGVMNEHRQAYQNNNDIDILFEKNTKTRGLFILKYENKTVGMYFIFRRDYFGKNIGAYKPIPICENMDFVPKKYHNEIVENFVDYEKEIYNKCLEYENKKLPTLKENEEIILQYIKADGYKPYDFLEKNMIIKIRKSKKSYLINRRYGYVRLVNFKKYYNSDYFKVIEN